MLRAFLAQWPFLGSARLLAPLSPAASLSWITVFHGISRRKVILMRKIALFAAALTALVLITVGTWTGVRTYPISVLAGSTVHASAMTGPSRKPPTGGLISTVSALSAVHRDLIITLAAKHKLPAVYQERNYVTADGLISYGPNFLDQFRRAAGYVDRILKGEKPADLPVQTPTKYELLINLKTAKALGLAVPPSVRARADEVIE